MPKKKTLKPYLIAFNVMEQVTNVDTGKIETNAKVRTTCIIAYSKVEAGEMFVKWLHKNGLYNDVEGVAVTRAKRTLQNAHLLTETFYKKEIDAIK